MMFLARVTTPAEDAWTQALVDTDPRRREDWLDQVGRRAARRARLQLRAELTIIALAVIALLAGALI